MEKENEVSPIQEDKSYVDEFLTNSKDEMGYLRSLGAGFIINQEHEWLQGFCKELEILREMSKIVNNQVEYLKNKHKQ